MWASGSKGSNKVAFFFSFFFFFFVCADTRIVYIIVKVCIERNHLQVELIRCRKTVVYFIHEATDSMQYRLSNANLDSGCQTVSFCSLETMGVNVKTMGVDISRWSYLADFVTHSVGALSLVTQTYCQYNESVHRKEQLATRINTI